jgi:UDP:flavonoid glycosyltransferase YjiC (YdhE family)
MICLFPNCAFLSETSRMIQIGKALTARGAEVCFATHGGLFESLLGDEGRAYDLVGPPMDAARSRRFIRDSVGVGDPRQSMYSHDEMRACVLAEAEYFRRKRVIAVIIGFTLTTLLSTRIARVPLVAQHAGAWIPPLLERSDRPPSPAMPRLYLSGFDALADELGVPRIPSFPALLLGDLSMVTEAPEVYGVREAEMSAWRPSEGLYWPSTRFVYTGPIFARIDCPIPPPVEAALRREGPIVYVAMTSAPAGLVRAAVREVASAGVEVVVAATLDDLSDLAGPRVTVAGILPSHRIAPRVTLAVTTGGQGSLQNAMAAGTPVIGIPLQAEQEANLRWLEGAGAARSLPAAALGQGVLAGLVRETLATPSCRLGALRIAAAYAQRDGPGLSAEAILRYLAPGDRQ